MVFCCLPIQMSDESKITRRQLPTSLDKKLKPDITPALTPVCAGQHFMTPFHLAFPIRDIDETRRFYGEVLGCPMGRFTDSWIDFDLFGHQMSGHVRADAGTGAASGAVDGHTIPIPHFGVVLGMKEWKTLAEKLEAAEAIDWIMKPTLRFEGQPGEQATLFVRDPSGNALEFKGFTDLGQVFAS